MRTFDAPDAYPLTWPLGYCRTPAGSRKRAHFGTVERRSGSSWKSRDALSVADACHRLRKQAGAFTRAGKVWRLDPNLMIVSSNVPVKKDGMPYSDRREPEDPGVAVYYTLDGKQLVMCCDKWDRVADNIAAIAATMEAMRSLERWGVSESERAFTGFAALPDSSMVQARTCWEVLGIQPIEFLGRHLTQMQLMIDAAYRVKAMECHPDRPGGSHEAMAELNTARDQANLYAERHA